MLRVAIFIHRHESFESRDYWLRAIADCWREEGIRVSVVSDPRRDIDADIAVLHIDLTVAPQEYLAGVHRFAVSINGRVPDISKRAISAFLLRQGDSYDGPVIVKTNRNNRGHQELRLARKGLVSFRRGDRVGNRFSLIKEKLNQIRRWQRYGSAKAFMNYPIFESVSGVPEAVWADDDFVVERFLPERSNGRYCVRTWVFLGDRERHGMFFSGDPIIKSHNIVDFEQLSEVPEELRQIRRQLQFDFGKFDYTMVEGRPILFDANRTPTIGDFPEERFSPIARDLAHGIYAFLQSPKHASATPAHT